MNQDVYRIGKCFSHRDCVIKITCKTSLLVSIFLSQDDIVFLSGIFKRWHKAGLVSAMIDALALSGKCTSGPNKSRFTRFTFWFGCCAPIICVYKESDWLGTKCRVDSNAQNTSRPCSIFRDLLLFQSFFTSNQSQEGFWMCTDWQSAFVDS